MLPKLERPKYDITLPLSGKKGHIHPFTVKEQKILALAEKEKNPDTSLNAIIDTIDKCSDLNPNELNTVDMQYTFLQIRKVSSGSKIDIIMTCPSCESEINTTIDIDDYTVVKNGDVKDIVMIDNKYGLKLSLPTVEKVKFVEDIDSDIGGVLLYIDSVFDEDEVMPIMDNSVDEIIEFINSLPVNVLEEISKYANSLPSYELHKDWKCISCSSENELNLVGIGDFFI